MKWLAVIGLVVTLAVASCAGGNVNGNDGASTDVPAATSTPVATPTQTVAQSLCGGGSLEGCFSYSQMGTYLGAIVPTVEAYFEEEYPKVAAPRDIVYVARGRVANGVCGPSTSDAFEYCPGNQTIYVGQDTLWQFYKGAGDAAPALALAHEWGHHLQFMLDVPNPQTSVQSIRFENQADCIAGAWAKYATEQGWMEEDDDLQDVDTLIEAIGSRETRGRDHGTTAERRQAFEISYEKGISACDSYFPNSPLA